MTPLDFTGYHHAAFATADLEKTIAYWRDLLGFRLAITFKGSEGRQYAFSLPQGMVLYFFEWPEVSAPSPKRHGMPVKGPFHFDHIALGLASEAELFRLQDRLVENDFPVSNVMDHGYLRSIYTFDPNGIPLEFNTVILPVDLATDPVLADRNPSPAVKEGPAPVPNRWKEAEEEREKPEVIETEDRKLFHP